MKTALLLSSLTTLNPTYTTKEIYNATDSIFTVTNTELKDTFNLDTNNSIPFSRQNLDFTPEHNKTKKNNLKEIDYIKESINDSLNNTQYMKGEIQKQLEIPNLSTTFDWNNIDEIINYTPTQSSNKLEENNTTEEIIDIIKERWILIVVDTIILCGFLKILYSSLKQKKGGNKKGEKAQSESNDTKTSPNKYKPEN